MHGPTQRDTGGGGEVAEALAAWAERVRRCELDRLEGRAGLGPADRALLDAVTLRLVDALIGSAVHRLRQPPPADDSALAEATRELFGLP